MTYTYHDDNGQQRRLLAVEVRYQGRRVGWVEPADIVAFIDGDIDEAGLLTIAALCPDPPADAQYIGPAPDPFVVEEHQP